MKPATAPAPRAVFTAIRLPDGDMLDDVMYKAIALGFAFFTVATILGALWAAEAWGGYRSWDPKETWALIVWLNYAAWLHTRLTKGWRGAPWRGGQLSVYLSPFSRFRALTCFYRGYIPMVNFRGDLINANTLVIGSMGRQSHALESVA